MPYPPASSHASRISFLIPFRNAENTIARCLFSLPIKSEILLWDDHSTDKSIDIIREVRPNAKIYTSRERLSVGKMRSELYKYSSREVVIFQDADDYRFLSPTVRASFSVDKNTVVFSPLMTSEGVVKSYNDPITDLLLMTFQTNCLLWHRSALDKLTFTERSCWEYHMFYDALLAGVEVKYIDYFTAVYTGQGQYSKQFCLDQILERLSLVKQAVEDFSMTHAQYNRAQQALDVAHAHRKNMDNRCLVACFTSDEARANGTRCLSNCNQDNYGAQQGSR